MSVELRLANADDASYLKSWLLDSQILRWFPMESEQEVDDAMRIWTIYANMGAAVAASVDGEPIGMANLYLQPFDKYRHQCLFSIVVSPKHRGCGVGSKILEELMRLAKEVHKIEILHLEVYDGNPAVFLYQKMGFREYGRHHHFIKEGPGVYVDRILMRKDL